MAGSRLCLYVLVLAAVVALAFAVEEQRNVMEGRRNDMRGVQVVWDSQGAMHLQRICRRFFWRV